jgi:hypothetical protein
LKIFTKLKKPYKDKSPLKALSLKNKAKLIEVVVQERNDEEGEGGWVMMRQCVCFA